MMFSLPWRSTLLPSRSHCSPGPRPPSDPERAYVGGALIAMRRARLKRERKGEMRLVVAAKVVVK
mgnify:CR=1 FL=1